MPKITADIAELDAFERKLTSLSDQVEEVAKAGLYEGAGVAADALKASINSLKHIDDVSAIKAARARHQHLISYTQVAGLRDGMGISPMKERGGVWSVKVGFHGYNAAKSKKWPQGQVNQMIAAACEHGTSAMIRQPFIRPTFSASLPAIYRALVHGVTTKITGILDGTDTAPAGDGKE